MLRDHKLMTNLQQTESSFEIMKNKVKSKTFYLMHLLLKHIINLLWLQIAVILIELLQMLMFPFSFIVLYSIIKCFIVSSSMEEWKVFWNNKLLPPQLPIDIVSQRQFSNVSIMLLCQHSHNFDAANLVYNISSNNREKNIVLK